MDLLSIPLISADLERVLSNVKNLVTDRRNSLNEDTIEACTVLRQRLKKAELK